MSGILTRWVVLQEYPVAQEPDGDGTVSDETVEQWVDAARLAYLERCELLRQAQEKPGVELHHRATRLPPGAMFGRPASVLVTASASEVRPSSFTISVRLRPYGGDRDLAVNATCLIRLVDSATGEARPLGSEIRDELIALEHSAEHFN